MTGERVVAVGQKGRLDDRVPVRQGEMGFKLLEHMVKGGVICFVVWQMRVALEALAGSDTSVNVLVNWVVGGRGTIPAMSLLFGAGGIGYGIRERRSKKHKTEAMAKRIQRLERGIDPDRTSSGLAPDGDTNPDDL